eukprot:1430887-Pyramimonas_sp.AAC.1
MLLGLERQRDCVSHQQRHISDRGESISTARPTVTDGKPLSLDCWVRTCSSPRCVPATKS